MNARDLSLVLSGAVLAGYVVAGIFFCRFWSQTRERLFACFAFAFFTLAVERILLLAGDSAWAHQPPIYVTRLLAFSIIIWAIWDRNRQSRK